MIGVVFLSSLINLNRLVWLLRIFHQESIHSWNGFSVLFNDNFNYYVIELRCALCEIQLGYCCVPKSFSFRIVIIFKVENGVFFSKERKKHHSRKLLRKIMWTSFWLIGLEFYNYSHRYFTLFRSHTRFSSGLKCLSSWIYGEFVHNFLSKLAQTKRNLQCSIIFM